MRFISQLSKTMSVAALFGASLPAFAADFSCPAGTSAHSVEATVSTDFVSPTETRGPITGTGIFLAGHENENQQNTEHGQDTAREAFHRL